ncbi:hypothetical protein C8J56DRAFT_881718 [Mycena floridula]|nr:hypothetical protein C8J56DRAFT_881718 [Mycena floridula]
MSVVMSSDSTMEVMPWILVRPEECSLLDKWLLLEDWKIVAPDMPIYSMPLASSESVANTAGCSSNAVVSQFALCGVTPAFINKIFPWGRSCINNHASRQAVNKVIGGLNHISSSDWKNAKRESDTSIALGSPPSAEGDTLFYTSGPVVPYEARGDRQSAAKASIACARTAKPSTPKIDQTTQRLSGFSFNNLPSFVDASQPSPDVNLGLNSSVQSTFPSSSSGRFVTGMTYHSAPSITAGVGCTLIGEYVRLLTLHHVTTTFVNRNFLNTNNNLVSFKLFDAKFILGTCLTISNAIMRINVERDWAGLGLEPLCLNHKSRSKVKEELPERPPESCQRCPKGLPKDVPKDVPKALKDVLKDVPDIFQRCSGIFPRSVPRSFKAFKDAKDEYEPLLDANSAFQIGLALALSLLIAFSKATTESFWAKWATGPS